MWIDADGAFHTVALPEPADVLTADALASLHRLRNAEGAERVEEFLAREEDALLDGEFLPDSDDQHVGAVPPMGVLDGDLGSLESLSEALGSVPERWRLDVLQALADLNDEG